jgi:hypothetical protein
LNKNEIAILFSPKLIVDTFKKIKILLDEIKKIHNFRKMPQNNQYGIGYDYSNTNYWIGLVPTIDSKHFLSLAIYSNQKPVFKHIEDVYFDGNYYYVPYNSDDAKEIGNRIKKNSITNLIDIINNNHELESWLCEPQKRIVEIKNIYGLSNKIQKLVKKFVDDQELKIEEPTQQEKEGGKNRLLF